MRIAACAALAGCLSLPASAAAGMLDTFDVSAMPSMMLAAPMSTNFVDDPVAGVAGARRDTTLSATAATSAINSVRFEVAAGLANYASGPFADGALTLLYEGSDLAADLGEAPESLRIDFLLFDDAFGQGMDVTITIADASAVAELTHTVTGSALNPFSLSFTLADFSNVAAVDLDALLSIRIAFEPAIGQDFQLEGINTVAMPEPSSLLLASIAGAGLFIRRLRRRR